jgi:hypothetical protein
MPPIMALLFPDGTVYDETGRELDLLTLDSEASERKLAGAKRPRQIYGFADTASKLYREGKGSLLTWNGEAIRWRKQSAGAEEWKNKDAVSLIKMPEPNDWQSAMRGFCDWRDWLAENGAIPTGTLGGASWSLLRANIPRRYQRIWLGVGDPPPLPGTLGGRQELGIRGSGEFVGRFEQLDLPAAYTHEIGNVVYGTRWYQATDWVGGFHCPEWWYGQNQNPTFVEATVKIPDLPWGPLPKRPARNSPGNVLFLRLGAQMLFPTKCTLRGIWCWEEVMAAVEHGCRIIEVHDIWGHKAAGKKPFAPWWESVQRGRDLSNPVARQLAKMTGNALWGRLCMDTGISRKHIMYRNDQGKLVRQKLPTNSGPPPDHALAETVSGRVRAKLYREMMACGEKLISAHTDGFWTEKLDSCPDGWRVKYSNCSRIRVLNPQALQYTVGLTTHTIYSGAVPFEAEKRFEVNWKRHMKEKERREFFAARRRENAAKKKQKVR